MEWAVQNYRFLIEVTKNVKDFFSQADVYPTFQEE